MLCELRHRGKIDVLDVRKWNLGIIAKMSLQLAGVVIARQIKLVKARNDPIIHDLDDIRLLHVFRHPADDRPIFTGGRGTEPFAVTFDHFWQIEIYLITGPVLDQGYAVTVFDLAAH